MIDSFKVKTLCLAEFPSYQKPRKARLLSGAFAQNFIYSSRMEELLDTFKIETKKNPNTFRFLKNSEILAQTLCHEDDSILLMEIIGRISEHSNVTLSQ